MAFEGDALLYLAATKRIISKYGPSCVGFATEQRKNYIQNRSMERFLLDATDLKERIGEHVEYNSHSFGTIFEALYCVGLKDNPGLEYDFLDPYFDWLDQHPVEVEYDIIEISRFGIEVDYFFHSKNCSLVSSASGYLTWKTNLEIQNDAFKKEKKAKETTLSTTVTATTTLITSTGHGSRIIGVSWKSRAGYTYEDPYDGCCGVREGRGCLRSLWPDPTAEHVGKMLIHSSRRQGGGNYQGHIPRGNAPQWTCCRLVSTAPGCISNMKNYKLHQNHWMDDYEKLIAEEMHVFHHSQHKVFSSAVL
jgi:hypothetical protein